MNTIDGLDATAIAMQYQAALDAAGVDGVKIAAADDGQGLVVTSTRADGTTATARLPAPEIDAPEGASGGAVADLTDQLKEKLVGFTANLGQLDKAGLNEVADRLENLGNRLVGDLKGSSGAAETVNAKATSETETTKATTTSTTSTGNTGTVSATYCLYKLLSLMLEVARQQRETARDMRDADNKMVIAQMEGQRQKMIDDAWAGLVGSLVCATIQSGMFVGNAVNQYQSHKATDVSKVASGEQTAAHVKEMAARANDPQAIGRAKESAGKTLDAAANKLLDTKNVSNEQRAAATDARQTIDNQFDNNNTLQGQPNENEGQLAARKIEANNATLETYKAQQAEVRSKLNKEAAEGGVTDATLNEMKLANAKVEYATARKLEVESGLANDLVVRENNGANTTVGDLRQGFVDKTSSEHFQAVGNSRSSVHSDIASRKSDRAKQWFEASTITNVLATGINNTVQQLRQSDTKAYDQSIEYSREQRESSKDLVASALDAFKQFLSVLTAIAESERTTFREIMG